MDSTYMSDFEKAKRDMFSVPDYDSDPDAPENMGRNGDDSASAMSGMTGEDTLGNRSRVIGGAVPRGAAGDSEGSSEDYDGSFDGAGLGLSDSDPDRDDESRAPPRIVTTRKDANLEFTMRTTGGESRGANSIVQFGSLPSEESGLSLSPCLSDFSPSIFRLRIKNIASLLRCIRISISGITNRWRSWNSGIFRYWMEKC